jgi:hypothetical protein
MQALERLILVLLLSVAILFVAQAGSWAHESWGTWATQRALMNAQLTPGQPVLEPVVSLKDGEVAQLSQVATGKCSYVIIASSLCPYSRAAQNLWTVTMLNEKGTIAPPGWEVAWVLLRPGDSQGQFFDPAFPAPTFGAGASAGAGRASHFLTAAGVSGFPFHLVLDRAGQVVRGGLGAPLPPVDAFKSDCTLEASTVEEAYTPVGAIGVDQ